MKNNSIDNSYTFFKLQWDTDFFGVKCAKAVLHKPLTLTEWIDLKDKLRNYQFTSIENRNSEPNNAQLIGRDTSAFLVDVNIQFKKKIGLPVEHSQNIKIYQALERNERIIELGDFKFSKFTEDPELLKRGGARVYRQWLINAFGKADKFYALSKDENGETNGFLLHSYAESACIVELIAVSQNVNKHGIGTNLFKAVEYQAYQLGCVNIRVGTQVRNMGAINFYCSAGCKQVGCHQVYHLWKL